MIQDPCSRDIIVLGLDPGSRCTGYGFVRERSGQAALLDVGTIRLNPKAPVAERLGRIFSELSRLIRLHKPHEAAVENVFVAKNTASALKLGQARGAALAAMAVGGLPVASYEPTVVKKTVVGVGRADKSQVAFMVGRILNVKAQWPADASDALAVAICHLNMRRMARICSL